MSAYNPADDRLFVKASQLDNPESEGRVCPHCSKRYDNDGRARAAFLRHVADCSHQTNLDDFDLVPQDEQATDEDVRDAVRSLEDEETEDGR